MPAHPVRRAFGLAAVGLSLTAFDAGPATAQQALAVNTPASPQVSRVSEGDCAAFRHYLADEVKAFPGQFSVSFLKGVMRFAKAGCATHDADGEIQLITETNQDGISFGTALYRMGKVDILSTSGVKHCHRPPNGICPTQTGAATAHPGAGG